MATETNQLGSAGSFQYDALGNVRWVADRNGRVVQYSYDNRSQRTAESWFENVAAATAVRTLSFSYDLNGNLTAASDPAASLGFVYDARQQATVERTSVTGLPHAIAFDRDYDLMGNQTSLRAYVGGTYNYGNQYIFDGLYRMIAVTQTGVARAAGSGATGSASAVAGATGSASAAAGATGSASAAAGATGSASAVASKHVTFSYDVAGQMTDVTRYAAAGASSGFVAQSHFGYDQAGRLTSLVHAKTPLPTTNANTWNGDFGAAPTTDPTKTLAAYHLTYDERKGHARSWLGELIRNARRNRRGA